MPVVWTPALIAELTRLHALVPEVSFSDIALRLRAQGHAVTRNGCIGKARRLGLEQRDPAIVTAANTRRLITYQANRMKEPRMPSIVVKEKSPPLVPAVHNSRTGLLLIELEFGECKWPINDGKPFRFCGCAQHPGRPCCTRHTEAAYHPVRR